MMKFLHAIFLLSSVVSVQAAATPLNGVLKKSDIPSTGQNWLSVSPDGAEVQHADFSQYDAETEVKMQNTLNRMLSGNTMSRANDYSTVLIDGGDTYYDEYSQAWRLLGLYIDCDPSEYDMQYQYDENNGNADHTDEECTRYLLWAAYIDLDYSGGGIGEYQFWDRHAQEWNTNSCVANDGRCEPMDCHLPETNFRLLGFFKEPSVFDWMEQLFKHEGICIWTDEEYEFMQNEREVWPDSCTEIEGQEGLYYDMKPQKGGGMTVGVYSDSACIVDYGDDEMQMAILKEAFGREEDDEREEEDGEGRRLGEDENENDGNAYELEEYIEKWNDAFDIFKVCQPCKAYNLGYNTDLQEGEDRQGGEWDYDDDDDDNENPYFTCKDDAGYKNVNQCMKFRTKTNMLQASLKDIQTASAQGTIVEITLRGRVYGDNAYLANTHFKSVENYTGLFVSSLLVFVSGLSCFIWACTKKDKVSFREPLIP